MMKKIVDLFTSLKLAVGCLVAALVLVFIGTLAQVKLGLYVAQENYFQSIFVMWGPEGANWKIPIWPGGYLIGWVLLLNLIGAHIKRFQFSWKKSGIIMLHAGLILLLIGQFMTELLQVESNMRIEEGESKNYAENTRLNELAVIEHSTTSSNKVVAFSEKAITKGKELSHTELPFTLRVKDYFPNSIPQLPRENEADAISATNGAGRTVQFKAEPITAKMDDENKPVTLIQAVAGDKVLGEWAVSTWLTKFPWAGALMDQLGDRTGPITDPQTFEFNGKIYEVAMRPIRYYKPFSLSLHDFRFDRYQGTDIPKNYSSRVQLVNEHTGENREVLIYMNNPLRYNGETYYQASFDRSETATVLQVVRNPAWLTPYFSCVLVGLGLGIHFTIHLVAFARRRQQSQKGTPANKPLVEPATVGTKA